MRRWIEWALPDCPGRDDVASVATELASNAIRHTRSGCGGAFVVEISRSAETVRVAVTDGGAPGAPRLVDDPDGETGRGLVLVRALAVSTGVRGDHRSRMVWAEVPCSGERPWPAGESHGLGLASDHRQADQKDRVCDRPSISVAITG
ncbi:MAG TPA: ATP-binding protein [Streptosporangiaceae bacterium]|nr:ATP-binding protein [Streptosporangiaceae bacterium]